MFIAAPLRGICYIWNLSSWDCNPSEREESCNPWEARVSAVLVNSSEEAVISSVEAAVSWVEAERESISAMIAFSARESWVKLLEMV